MIEGKVVVLKIFKSEKKNKTLITYGKEDSVASSNSVGLNIIDEWFDSSSIFDKFSKEDILKPLDAKYTYVEGFNGNARPKLMSLVNTKGIDVIGQ